MGRIIAIANQKGGVGKTTTAINLSATLAEAGEKVLAVDFDPQGNETSGFGVEKNQLEQTVYEMLIGECKLSDCIIREVQPNLDLIPSNVNLAGAEIELLEMENKEKILRGFLSRVKKVEALAIDPHAGIPPLPSRKVFPQSHRRSPHGSGGSFFLILLRSKDVPHSVADISQIIPSFPWD